MPEDRIEVLVSLKSLRREAPSQVGRGGRVRLEAGLVVLPEDLKPQARWDRIFHVSK